MLDFKQRSDRDVLSWVLVLERMIMCTGSFIVSSRDRPLSVVNVS